MVAIVDSPDSVVTVRPYQPSDDAKVKEIFKAGMLGLAPIIWSLLWQAVWPLPALTTALPAAALYLCRGRHWVLGAAVSIIASAAPSLLARLYVQQVMACYVNYSLKTDLQDILAFYSDTGAGPGSKFWVACVPKPGDKPGEQQVVGCVALERKSDEVAELRRMSVAPGFRRYGVATRLCQELLDHARRSGFKRVVLSTSSAQAPAMRLYSRLGWVEEKVEAHESGALAIHHFTYTFSDTTVHVDS